MNAAGLEMSKSRMNTLVSGWRLLLILYLLSLLIYGGMAAVQSTPGYMDADYYFSGALQIASGEGFWEPFLWNYLDDPQAIPHPSHAYWMPLASLVAALGIFLSGSQTFNAAQIGMVFLAAGIPALTALLARQFTDRVEDALLAGTLAIFSGFYFPYLTTTDTFGVYMLLGALYLLLVGNKEPPTRSWQYLQPIGLGFLAGAMHLARADGLIWLVTGILVGWFIKVNLRQPGAGGPKLHSWLIWIAACLGGYLIVMGPWMARNLTMFGSPLAPGGVRALWITSYDELYTYPAAELTFQRWLQTGLRTILTARWQAFWQNLQSLLAVQGQIFLAPLMLIGVWKMRHNDLVKTGMAAWGLTILAMTLLFPYQGARGGLFHSGSALQPLFWALVPVGLRAIVKWGARLRGWNLTQALVVFQLGLVGLAIFLTTLLVASRVFGTGVQDPQWNRSLDHYVILGETIASAGAQTSDIVMVNNAPGFFIATGRPALSVPNGSLDVTLEVGHRYHACYLLLEPNHPAGLDPLYQLPGDRPGLLFVETVDQTHLFQLKSCSRETE
jgi:hypothetical protein